MELDPDYPLLPYGVDSKYSLIAKAVISQKGLQATSYLPVLIDTQLRPEVLGRNHPRFDEVVSYLKWASERHNCDFKVDGDEVRLG